MLGTSALLDLLTIAACVGSGIAGGFYVAFSAVVMPALRSRPPMQAAETMNSINRRAVRAPFMIIFFGTAVASIAVVVGGLMAGDGQGLLRTLGAVLYLSGFVLTMVHNVPLNNRLATETVEAAAAWRQWERRWTRGNTVRALVSAVGALLLAAAR